MSASLYDTFGNEISYDLRRGILTAYIEDATIDFPLPQASAEILGSFKKEDIDQNLNGPLLEQVKLRLESSGFSEANANALSIVLLKVSEKQGIHPFEFFELTTNTLKITKDAYDAINALRPVGNRVNLVVPLKNSKSSVSTLIKA